MLLGVFNSGLTQARVVNSADDEIRLKGFQQHLDALKVLEANRLTDEDEILKQKLSWQKKMDAALEEYRIEKAHQEKTVNDTGDDYQMDVDARLRDFTKYNSEREAFVNKRDQVRAQEQRDVSLSEEAEYFLADNTDRVDWNKRKFFDKPTGSGALGASLSPGGAGFNSEVPPPPPPAIPYEPPPNNWENAPPPPPPPPGMFEEENPF